jgi:hypothetical protein
MENNSDDLFSGLARVRNFTYDINVNEEVVFVHKFMHDHGRRFCFLVNQRGGFNMKPNLQNLLRFSTRMGFESKGPTGKVKNFIG